MGETNDVAALVMEMVGRLEAKIDNLVTRREFEIQQKDIDRAHSKYRELEERVRSLENSSAADRGEQKGRFSFTEKAWAVVFAIVTAAAMAYLKLT